MFDVGCGKNPVINYFRNNKFSVYPKRYTALDSDLELTRKLKNIDENIQIKSDINDLNENYDLTIAKEVIEHIPRDACNDFLNQIKKRTRKMISITVPNHEHWPSLVDKNLSLKNADGGQIFQKLKKNHLTLTLTSG